MARDHLLGVLRARWPSDRPLVLAVDGRSGGGKSTVAEALREAADATRERATIVHTDDVAWFHARMAWDDLFRRFVLQPVRAGAPVSWQPPAWRERGRAGAIEIAGGTTLVIVEGVGAARRSLAPFLDLAVWVQSDQHGAYRRGIERDMNLYRRTREEAESFWADWATEEEPHFRADQPWARASLVVAGTPTEITPGPGELVVASRSPLLTGAR